MIPRHDVTEVTEISGALRALALAGLADWLETPAPAMSVPPQGMAGLVAMLADHQDLTRQQIAAARRLSRGFVMTDPPDWTPAQTGWIARHFRPGWPAAALAFCADLLTRRCGAKLRPGGTIAPLLINAVATQIWVQPDFRRDVAHLFREHLRRRVILFPDTGAPPVLGLPTLWAATARGFAFAQSGAGEAGDARIAARLARHAARMIATEGWAGFWDGYVLSHTPAATDAAFHLPLALGRNARPAPQFRPHWRDDIPGYAQPLLAGAI